MASSENNDEKKLKQCFESILNLLSDTIQNLQGKTNEQQLINDLKGKLKTLLDKYLLSLSSQCKNYLLNLLYKYNFNDKDKTLNFIRKDMLNSFLNDCQAYFKSIDVFNSAWNGDQKIVQQFLETYPQFKDKSGLYQTTLLYSAARNNHLNLVKYLLENAQCSVNAQNEEYLEKGQHSSNKATIGSTALHAACYQGHLSIVKYLISNGGDYFILNNAKETPIQNSKSKSNIRQFFNRFLFFGYSEHSTNLANNTIIDQIEQNNNNQTSVDCIWEYKPLSIDQWYPFGSDPSSILQQSLLKQPIQSEISLQTGRDSVHISIPQFLRYGKNPDQLENCAWIRCRGSSLLNFQCYSQWQLMFIKYQNETKDSSPTVQTFNITKDKIQLNCWFNIDNQRNFLFETAMNYRRKYLNINFDLINNQKFTFDLENLIFINQDKTIQGFIRWIPKFLSNKNDLTLMDNFQLGKTSDLLLLTISTLKQIHNNSKISKDKFNQYILKYEKAFQNDDLDFINQSSSLAQDSALNKLINVIRGNLLSQNTDVIVVCSLSKSLVNSVFKAGGKSLKKTFDNKVAEDELSPVISIPADGELQCKSVYFVPWKPNSDPKLLIQSIELLVRNIIKQAASENYKSIAFPAIGCGQYACSVNTIAQTFIREIRKRLEKYRMNILFVIEPDKTDIYQEFRKQIDSLGQQDDENTLTLKSISLNIGKGIISIEQGDITKQSVDVIIGSSSSENLRQVLFKAGGDQVKTSYSKEYKTNPNSIIISTSPGNLNCKRIFFLKWEPDEDPDVLRQSIIDLMWNVIQNVNAHNYQSIAFPALGCGEHACSVDIVVKTMVREIKQQFEKRKLSWTFKFIIQPNQQNVYDEFSKQLLSSDHISNDYQIPSTWQNSKDNQIKFILPKNSEEYQTIMKKFEEAMKGNYTEIIKVERIQNERWYMQYMAHVKDFKKRLNEDTEKLLYHGCPQVAAEAIIQDCFNRSFAGVNGTVYGVGVYFSKNAIYSHGYTRIDANGERCMFVARVLVGKTTLGNSSMKTRPLGFDSTTDEDHMFVTYHDAQAYAEYLITYK